MTTMLRCPMQCKATVQKHWNGSIPQHKYQQTFWIQPWFQSGAGFQCPCSWWLPATFEIRSKTGTLPPQTSPAVSARRISSAPPSAFAARHRVPAAPCPSHPPAVSTHRARANGGHCREAADWRCASCCHQPGSLKRFRRQSPAGFG